LALRLRLIDIGTVENMHLITPYCSEEFMQAYWDGILFLSAVIQPFLSQGLGFLLDKLWWVLGLLWILFSHILIYLIKKKIDRFIESVLHESERRGFWVVINALITDFVSGVDASRDLVRWLKVLVPEPCSYFWAREELGAATFDLELPSGKVKGWHFSANELLGLVPDDVLGCTLDRLLIQESNTKKLKRFLESGKSHHYAIFGCHQRDGQSFKILVLGYVEESGQILHCLAFRVANPLVVKILMIINRTNW
jgi:hypothetical protein